MSSMQIDSVLSQIRSMSSQLHGQSISKVTNLAAEQAAGKTTASSGDFASLMRNGIDQVNQSQLHASSVAAAFERGTPGVELPDVMLEMQKANVSFRALTEVRNRFVSAYQEVMNMQI